jgi:hypothetical protein
MSDWHVEGWDEDDAQVPEPASRRFRAKMPVSSDARAKAASKATWKSRQATKRVARAHGSIRNRRQKRVL